MECERRGCCINPCAHDTPSAQTAARRAHNDLCNRGREGRRRFGGRENGGRAEDRASGKGCRNAGDGWLKGGATPPPPPSHESRERVGAAASCAPSGPGPFKLACLPPPRASCCPTPPRCARGGRERRGAGAAFAWAADGGQELAQRGSGRKNRDGGEGRRGGAHLAGRAVRRRRGCRRRLPRADSASMLLFLGLGAYSMPLPWRNSFG